MKKLIQKTFIIFLVIFASTTLYAQSGNHHGHNHNHGTKIIDNHAHDELYMESKKKHSTTCFHDKELPKRKIQRAAKVKLWQLAYNGKITESWLDMPIVATDKKKFQYDVEYVVQFKDASVKNKRKQIIYVFVDLYGQVTGANYVGH